MERIVTTGSDVGLRIACAAVWCARDLCTWEVCSAVLPLWLRRLRSRRRRGSGPRVSILRRDCVRQRF
jgi:hypothetical protein